MRDRYIFIFVIDFFLQFYGVGFALLSFLFRCFWLDVEKGGSRVSYLFRFFDWLMRWRVVLLIKLGNLGESVGLQGGGYLERGEGEDSND